MASTREIAHPDIMCTTMFDYDGSRPASLPSPIRRRRLPARSQSRPRLSVCLADRDRKHGSGRIDGLETLTRTGCCRTAPWGGTLPLQVQFDPRPARQQHHLLPLVVPFHQSWVYTQISAPVTHRYQEISIGPGGGDRDSLARRGVGAASGWRPKQSVRDTRSVARLDRHQRSCRQAIRIFRQHGGTDPRPERLMHAEAGDVRCCRQPRIVRQHRPCGSIQIPAARSRRASRDLHRRACA